MKKLLIISLYLALFSCAPSRKLTRTSSDSRIDISSSYTDTSKTSSSWESILATVVNQIDLSKIRITTYSQEKDSTGHQLIESEITIDKNITITTTTNSKEQQTKQENKAIQTQTDITGQSKTNTEVIVKKGSSSLKSYLIFSLLASIIAGLIVVKFKRPIVKIFKRMFK